MNIRVFRISAAVLALALGLLCGTVKAEPSLTLEQVMAHPSWIGPWPKEARFSPSGKTLLYKRSRLGRDSQDRPLRGDEVVELDRSGRELQVHPFSALPESDSRWGSSTIFLWGGDLFLETSERLRLTQGGSRLAGVRWIAKDRYLLQSNGHQIDVVDAGTGARRQLVELLTEDQPDSQEKEFVPALQDRLFPVLKEREEADRKAKQVSGVPVIYVGKNRTIIAVEPSSDLRYLLVVHTEKSQEKRDLMPGYLTRTGDTDSKKLRPKVGAEEPVSHRFTVYDLQDGSSREVDLSGLPRMTAERKIRLEKAVWSQGQVAGRLAVLLLSQDFKDRWLLEVDLPAAKVTLVDESHDPAWQAWDIDEFGWTSDGDSLWFQSEKSGYAHLYLWNGKQVRALTQGPYEVRDITATSDNKSFVFRANKVRPTRYDIYRVDREQRLEKLTDLGGMTEFAMSPDGKELLLIHSKTAEPPELYLQPARPGATPKRLTENASPEFRAFDWTLPEFLDIPSSHHSRGIPSKLYLPPQGVQAGAPAVVFVHGAGYLQNADEGWSNYFREFMFHTLLTRMGVIVLDMDYRASMGYGRDWRAAIYRQMGTPELEDLKDGVAYLVEEVGVDPNRIGVYGGSYGGFMTLMALFKEPDLFACGAALRSVTDWSQYQHEYTGRILNSPKSDPESFLRSSPIEFAEGLSKPLLMTHGILDDNVVAQDTIRLAQRLIELEKENWEMALYPLEPHGFIEPSSWLDQYRRILKLFRENLEF